MNVGMYVCGYVTMYVGMSVDKYVLNLPKK